ncbi:MAG TPA: MBL fold metallo-hydrolase [Balneolales bacterium]|nr:MBL fold metallo-hydrolase [Balneolales bacterium]
MTLKTFKIEQLSEGLFQIGSDGSIEKLVNRKRKKEYSSTSGIFSRIRPIGIDPILVYNDDYKILLDAGVGLGLDKKNNDKRISNIVTNMEIFGIHPEDITHVILTHLHYDHIGGLTYTDEHFHTRPTLPNAKYYVQKREWEHALHVFDKQPKMNGATYQLDDIYRLVADDLFVFIDEDYFELTDGVEIIWTGGHTPGHQIVRLSDHDKHVAYYFGDLIPSDEFLNYSIKKIDVDIKHAKQMKMALLRQAYHEEADLLFYHSLQKKSGKLVKDKYRKYTLQTH